MKMESNTKLFTAEVAPNAQRLFALVAEKYVSADGICKAPHVGLMRM